MFLHGSLKRIVNVPKQVLQLNFLLVPPFGYLRIPRSARPQQPPPQPWVQDPDRPSIVSATELKELDNLDNDADEGWAGL